MNDDGGVLGRLPRSRPGTRSEKRAGDSPANPEPAAAKEKPKPAAAKSKPASRPAAGAKRAASASERRDTPGPGAKRPARAKRAAEAGASRAKARPAAEARPPRSKPMPKEPRRERPAHSVPPAQERGGDPVTEVIRAGAKVAEGGVKLAGGLARELLRRLPRP